MALNIGRKGFVEVGVESTYGTPVATTATVPYTDNTLSPVSEPIADTSARGVRESQFASVVGKKWTEGDISFNLDSKIYGYFAYAAMGTVNTSTLSGSIKQHTFSRNNANTPKSLTMIYDRGSIDQYFVRGAAVKTMEVSVGDQLATVKNSILGKFQGTTASGVGTTASGNVFSFGNYNIRLGSSVANANAQSPINPSDMKITVENNSELIYRAGQGSTGTEVAQVAHKNFEVSGEFSLFFENTTDRDQYYANNKKAMEIKFEGAGLGSGYKESITYNVYQMRFDTLPVETGLDDFYMEKATWMAEYDNANAKSVEVVVVNTQASY